jgi:hypothetical protein
MSDLTPLCALCEYGHPNGNSTVNRVPIPTRVSKPIEVKNRGQV